MFLPLVGSHLLWPRALRMNKLEGTRLVEAAQFVITIGLHLVAVAQFFLKIGLRLVLVVQIFNKIGLRLATVVRTHIKIGLHLVEVVIFLHKLGLSNRVSMVHLLNKVGLSTCMVIFMDQFGLRACTVNFEAKLGLSMCLVNYVDAIRLWVWALARIYIKTVLLIFAIFHGMVRGEVDLEMECGKGPPQCPGQSMAAPP